MKHENRAENRSNRNRGHRKKGLLERIVRDVTSWFEGDEDQSRNGRGESRRKRAFSDGRRYDADERDRWARQFDEDDLSRENYYRGEPPERPKDNRPQDMTMDWDYRESEGPYRGRGPKGSQRSQETIREMVCDRVEDDRRVDASGIDVSCDDDEITLHGEVATRCEKRLAEASAESVRGVEDLHNRLTIRHGE